MQPRDNVQAQPDLGSRGLENSSLQRTCSPALLGRRSELHVHERHRVSSTRSVDALHTSPVGAAAPPRPRQAPAVAQHLVVRRQTAAYVPRHPTRRTACKQLRRLRSAARSAAAHALSLAPPGRVQPRCHHVHRQAAAAARAPGRTAAREQPLAVPLPLQREPWRRSRRARERERRQAAQRQRRALHALTDLEGPARAPRRARLGRQHVDIPTARRRERR